MSETARKYGTTNPVLIEARVNHDPYDEYAWCQDWRFAIADVLTYVKGETVPGFNSHGPDTDSYAYEMLADMDSSEDANTDALWYALKILDRYREWLRLAGRDY